MENYFPREVLMVFTMLANSFISSVLSAWSDSNCFGVMKLLPFNNSNQYSVSLASFKAMFILFKKSAFDCACSDSLIKAPIDVPLRRICFEITNSFFSLVRNLYNFTIRKAKSKLFGFKISSPIFKNNKSFSILNFQFSIRS